MSAGLLKSSGRIGQARWWRSLSRGLGPWASGIELPRGNGPSLPRNEGCVLGELRVAGLLPFTVIAVPVKFPLQNRQSNKAFLSPWTGCDNLGEGCGERNEGEGM